MELIVSSLIHRELPLIDALRGMRELGVTKVELCVDSIHSRAADWPISIEETLLAIQKIGVCVNSIHIPLPGANSDATIEQRKKESQAESIAAIDLAVRLSAKFVVQHVELNRSNVLETSEPLSHVIPDLQALADYAQDSGVRVALENVPTKNGPSMLGDNPIDVMGILSILKSEAVGMCLDVSHCVASGHDPVRIIKELDTTRLISLHVSDNSFNIFKDRHLPVGQGEIDWEKLFYLLDQKEFTGDIVVEVAGDMKAEQNLAESLRYLENYNKYFV